MVLGMLAAFAPLATDMYLPAFVQMSRSFHTDPAHIGTTLSAFFLGLALGQAVYGPLIDRFGRRRPLLIGIGLYLAATLLCGLTSDLTLFIALRVMQALGGSAGLVVGRALVRDLYDKTESARVYSLLLMVSAIAPIVAPVMGGYLLALSTWRLLFAIMLSFGLVCMLFSWLWIPETLPASRRRTVSIDAVLGIYARLCVRPAFIVPALVGGLALSCMYAFITGSPVVFIDLHGVSERHFGWLFAMTAAGLIIAAQLNRMLLRRRPAESILNVALLVNVAAGMTHAAVAGTDNIVILIIPLCITIASLGFIAGNSAAIAMAAGGDYAGSASAVIGVLQFCIACLVSSLVATLQNNTAYPMAIAIALAGSSAALLWFSTKNYRNRFVPL